MVDKFFKLKDSNNFEKKFAVIAGGYQPIKEKIQNIQTTVNGGLDVSMGGIYETHNYAIRTRETETRDGYGNIADLEHFFDLNNPNGSPSNVLTLTDHFGTAHSVYMVGQFQPSYIGIIVEGENAWAIFTCSFKFIPQIEGS